MRLIDADKLHVDKQINGKCWISQEQIINASTVEPQISKSELKDKMLKYGFTAPDMTVTEFVEDFESL